ncbi:hypothetical protein BJP36_43360 [Moorena producens JHB]|uniref:Uncharacterized protein n=1 Tax=Moorena producens (strain JHB) TaxID=1454205 RepID=A0A9Q9ST71_MOOP1|nr:hypothetical protein [Moorena producens]WAN69202.1 hypothetical protein BJP36_43360 [Moorena producens JHB]
MGILLLEIFINENDSVYHSYDTPCSLFPVPCYLLPILNSKF